MRDVTNQTETTGGGVEVAAQVAPVLLWTAGPDGACTFANQGWLAFTGRPLEATLGPGWREQVHPEDRERRQAALAGAVVAHEPFELEFRLRRHDGAWRWMLERAVPTAAGGGGGAVAGACFDITERREEERDLLRSREDLRLALAAGNMGTWVWDRDTGRVLRDPNLQALYGLAPDASDGSFDEWVSLVHPADRQRVLDEVERAMREGGTYQLEHRVIRPDGGVRWLERRGEVYFDEAGEVAGTRGLVVDVTGRRRGEEERARLLAAEQEARRAAERAAGRVARLQAVTAGLADARTVEDVAAVIVSEGAAGLAADSCALCLLTADGAHLEVVRQVGYDPTVVERFQTFALDAPLPASEALRRRETVVLRSLEERNTRFPVLAGTPSLNRSFAVVPLLSDGDPAGAVALGWHEERSFDEADAGFLTALGQQATQALDRARFHEAERRRAHRYGFLSEASRLLGSSLDHATALVELVRVAVPAVADSCSIHLLEDGSIRTAAEAHGGPAGAAVGQKLMGRSWCIGTSRLLEVATSAEALLVPRVDATHLREWADDEEHLSLMASLGTTAAMAVPLRSGDQTLGVVAVGTSAGGRPYGSDDLAFVEDLAARAAAAVANGRAHQARAAIAHTLQRSLLPPDVPLLPGLEVAARYRPVGPDVEVGGDFYDVFAAGGGRWGVMIGDVSGKGVPAASLTALARYTVRAAARGQASAAAVLDILNRTILDEGRDDERFCTVALALIDHDPGGIHMTLSCGGQPLPVLVDRDGAMRSLGRAGTAIGLFADPTLSDTSHPLRPGDSVVFYTDGVVEARSPEGAFGDGLLEATLASCAGRPAEDVARAVEQAVLDFGGGVQRDDLAVLVVRRPTEIFSERVVPGPPAVSRSRQRLREWLAPRLGGDTELAGDVVLVANELVTNAERAARGLVDLHVWLDDDRVVVDVADDGPGAALQVPPAVAPRVDATRGRGLHIVGRLADHCDLRSTSSGTLVRWVAHRERRR